ncbi:MAG: addiction module killer protein [Candidatus Komeilibacteria bacterium RIFCSPLOWO2_02_FULL_48_11]|uniref:Addiction module killer protein n=1 Tax=Candidatus Komeilibacteria bacterium RIFCSPLOWO2_02_FULL_48_11 TaxID=1798553 RepID=A0A1G2BT08_9BACT|nr:MAG: addiction module killer protein [Candidatus Komeilibacteria bacterium RIFCSPLOWO2_02_FULL_48_11]
MEVKIYQNSNGDEPFITWLESLRDETTRLRIRKRLRRIEQNNLGDAVSAGEGIYELRMHFGPGYRVYFGYSGPEEILLLVGGDKSSQVHDIQKAKHFWQDYKRSMEL